MGKVFASKFVGTGLSSYEKRIYRTAVSQRLRNTVLEEPTACIIYSRDEGSRFYFETARLHGVTSPKTNLKMKVF